MSRKKLHILFLSEQQSYFDHLIDSLADDGRFLIGHADTAKFGLEVAASGGVDLMIVAEELKDSTGLFFTRQLVAVNPLVNCALVSPLYPQEFHEQSEGLGLLMQLPVNPRTDDAERLVELLAKIYPALTHS